MQSVALLRGMNVGGHRITNDALRAAFEALGFTDVLTYRASGNVIFSGPATEDAASRIASGLEEKLGYAVPTLLRSADRLRHVAQLDPFSEADHAASSGKMQVTFLSRVPAKTEMQAVAELAEGLPDRLHFDAAELFWLPEAGVLDTALDLAALDRTLGLGTMRTHGTIQGISRKLD